jgi:hypothetical protein
MGAGDAPSVAGQPDRLIAIRPITSTGEQQSGRSGLGKACSATTIAAGYSEHPND